MNPTTPPQMTTPDKVLLILGIILFVVLLAALVAALFKGKPIVALLPFFLIPIAMIAFPEIGSLKGPGVDIEKQEQIQTNVVSSFVKNPGDETAAKNFRVELTRIDDLKSAHPDTPLPASTRSNLQMTVTALNRHPTLTPESRIALSHAQLLLGETNAAVFNLNEALKSKTNLSETIDPRLKTLWMRQQIN